MSWPISFGKSWL
jgi:hypothetical protein